MMQVVVKSKDDQETYDGCVLPTEESDIMETKNWMFNWHQEYVFPDRDILSLKVNGDPNVQALMSYEIDEGFVLIQLLESSPANAHSHGLKITPTMLCCAAQISFDHHCGGFVAINIKLNRKLMAYYARYGAKPTPLKRMYFDTIDSNRLFDVYLKDKGAW
ncbi:hypothetical protein EPH95_03870 [Salicibibacter halophilus]|uniref:GNAT family N-acetyltransferase n=1 Tax=Salicibibacter halophilus TaxID=2502791 RepID=A0A514LFV6_9BACI|nr:hypothetical protein [Salicibibacter halophilus]QDI90425.1 hypothetical protein EPH95_03870 [Salicibibacter halophilus]